jgi:hypothetical protein
VQLVKLIKERLRKALVDIRNDATKIPSKLSLEELATLVEPPRLAQLSLRLLRARVLRNALDRVRCTGERFHAAEDGEQDEVFEVPRPWTVDEASRLLEDLEEPGGEGSEDWERAVELALQKGDAREGPACQKERSPEEVLKFVQQVEELFGGAGTGGLAFAKKCFGQAAQKRGGLDQSKVQANVLEGYSRTDSDLLQLLKASGLSELKSRVLVSHNRRVSDDRCLDDVVCQRFLYFGNTTDANSSWFKTYVWGLRSSYLMLVVSHSLSC